MQICWNKNMRRRPVIFLTNGFETHIIDGQYPERKCSVIYSKRDLEKWFNLLSNADKPEVCYCR